MVLLSLPPMNNQQGAACLIRCAVRALPSSQADFGIGGSPRPEQETPAPMMQPNRALDIVQPERLPRAVSARCNGSMKLVSIEVTAPEMTAVS